MQIVILAAGTGSRLLPLTRNTPKSLLDLGDGYTLLERQLQAINDAGFHNVTLVTGYKAEQIEAKITHYQEFTFDLVYNPFYRLTNQIVSAWMGLQNCTGPVVLINGDDLFKPDVLERLVQTQHDITLMACGKDQYSDEDMKVILQDDRVLDIGKDIPSDSASGESIGMIYFSKQGLTRLQSQLNTMMRDENQLQAFFPLSIRQMIQQDYPVHSLPCSDQEWSEVDFHPDLQQMRNTLQQSVPHWK